MTWTKMKDGEHHHNTMKGGETRREENLQKSLSGPSLCAEKEKQTNSLKRRNQRTKTNH